MSKVEKIPILPIPNIVFFPNTSLPLYVVEPVYIQLIYHCVENDIPVGIAMADNDEFYSSGRLKPKKICGIGRPVILDELEDGSLKVLIRGMGRARLIQEEQHLPYSVYHIERYYDSRESSEEIQDEDSSRLKEILDLWLYDNIPDSMEREAFLRTLSSIYHVVDYICMFLIQDKDLRQLLLENPSLNERVYMLNILLKEENPFCEDQEVVNAIKGFEEIEYKEKISH